MSTKERTSRSGRSRQTIWWSRNAAYKYDTIQVANGRTSLRNRWRTYAARSTNHCTPGRMASPLPWIVFIIADNWVWWLHFCKHKLSSLSGAIFWEAWGCEETQGGVQRHHLSWRVAGCQHQGPDEGGRVLLFIETNVSRLDEDVSRSSGATGRCVRASLSSPWSRAWTLDIPLYTNYPIYKCHHFWFV